MSHSSRETDVPDRAPAQAEAVPAEDRREALRRLATYTAPVMLALLASEKAVAQDSIVPSAK